MRDLDIRRALHSQLRKKFGRDPNTRILDELGVKQGASRVDVAVVNGLLHGYEIKSERDTLQRLEAQEAAYSVVFDRMTMVVSAPHLDAVTSKVPAWWGIDVALASGIDIELRSFRPPAQNESVDLLAVAQLLWRDEVLAVLERRGHADGVRSKPRVALWTRLVERLKAEELKSEVRDAIKSRPSTWLAPSPPA